jgi:hypothetical protein
MRETAIVEVRFLDELCIPKNRLAFETRTVKQSLALKDGAGKVGIRDKSRFLKVCVGGEIDLGEIGRTLEAGALKGHGAFEPAFVEKRPCMKGGVGEVRIAAVSRFRKMGIVLEIDAREIDIALKLRSREIADSFELGSLETGAARELSVPERHFIGEFRVSEVRIMKDVPIEIRKLRKSRLTHELCFSELVRFFQPADT